MNVKAPPDKRKDTPNSQKDKDSKSKMILEFIPIDAFDDLELSLNGVRV